MNSSTWYYVGSRRKRSKLVLKHGVESGNLALFCNNKLIAVEYDVFNDHALSFFIDNELCRIEIKRYPKGFQYKFIIDKEADTPLNKFRKKVAKSDRRKSLLLLSSLAVFICLVLFGGRWMNRIKSENEILNYGLITQVVVNYEQEADFWVGRYTYRFRGAKYKGYHKLPLVDRSEASNSFAEEYLLRFSSRRPERHLLLVDRPSLKQLSLYQKGLMDYCREKEGLSEKACQCHLNEAYRMSGATAWQVMQTSGKKEQHWSQLTNSTVSYCR